MKFVVYRVRFYILSTGVFHFIFFMSVKQCLLFKQRNKLNIYVISN